MANRYYELMFCMHCGALHRYTAFTDAAGSTDWEYRKEKAGKR